MTRVFITFDAEADLEEITDFISEDSPARAASFAEELRRKALSIGPAPRIYRLRPEFGHGVRSAAHGRYLILFRILRDSVEILRIVHGARDIPKLFQK